MLEFKFYVFLLELEKVFWSFNQIIDLIFSWILYYDSVIKIDIIVESKNIHKIIIYLIWFIWKIVIIIELINILILKLIDHYSVSVLIALRFLVASFFVASIVTYKLLFFEFLLESALFFFLSFFLKFAFINHFLFLFIDCIIVLNNSWFCHCKNWLIADSFHKYLCHRKLQIVCIKLKKILGFFANRAFHWLSKRTDSACLVDSRTNQTELRLSFTNYPRNDWAWMNPYANF